MLCGCYIHEKDFAQYDLFDSGVYSREITTFFLSVKSLGLLKTLTFGIYSDTVSVINVKLWMMVLLIELYLFIPLSVTFTIFQGHSNVKQL